MVLSMRMLVPTIPPKKPTAPPARKRVGLTSLWPIRRTNSAATRKPAATGIEAACCLCSSSAAAVRLTCDGIPARNLIGQVSASIFSKGACKVKDADGHKLQRQAHNACVSSRV